MLAAIIVMLQLVTLPVLVSRAQEFDQQPEPGATSAPEPEPQIPAQEFSGEQPGQTEPFSLEGGLAVFDVVHDGGGNFILVLTDAEDERVDGLVNVIGGFDGSTAIHAPAGEYRPSHSRCPLPARPKTTAKPPSKTATTTKPPSKTATTTTATTASRAR
ncbi:MAG: hypothetical protein BRC32_03475 [Actinobacteria bacterium QS_8_72_14]|nr:MAG: hypothetical protein BRC32_03475 [Actinobacteria bacterium QS_8_72_14]